MKKPNHGENAIELSSWRRKTMAPFPWVEVALVVANENLVKLLFYQNQNLMGTFTFEK